MASIGDTNTTQETAPPGSILSSVLQQECTEAQRHSNSIDGTAGSISDMTIIRHTFPDQRTGTLSMQVFVIHKDMVYGGLTDGKVNLARLSEDLGMMVPWDEYEPVREQYDKSMKEAKDALKGLTKSSGCDRWSTFREQCQSLTDEVVKNSKLTHNLKQGIKRKLHGKLIITILVAGRLSLMSPLYRSFVGARSS
jgi:hypothetical protein